MKIEMNSKRQVIITPETRLESAMLEAWLRECGESVPPVSSVTPMYVPPTVRPPSTGDDPLGLRHGVTSGNS